MAMERLAVSVTCHTAQNGEATYWLGVVAFGKQADDLARHRKGDMVSVSGSLQLNQWKAQDGIQKEQPQVVADIVISARTARPGCRQSSEQEPPSAAPGWDSEGIYNQVSPRDDF
ncbi:single-stranded DNA-binding protein [Erwinia sp. S38]|uniref:single-stranded DNA-binding protein n=1 Tax=Erwinia sp. S38 TaxID=2769338 RepID=UPI001F2D4EC5